MKHLTFPEYSDAVKDWIVVVDFYAQRCPPCKAIAPELDKLAEQYDGKVSFYKVDVDEQQYLTGTQGITGMPTMKIYNAWSLVQTILWADLPKLQQALISLVK